MAELPAKMQALLQRESGFSANAKPAGQIGDVAQFLELAEVDLPVPRKGQVLIRVIASMVNPSDLMFIQGGYGQPRVKGAPAGFEGVGEVVGGKGLFAAYLKGKRVSFVVGPNGSGAWADYAVADTATVIPLKPGVKDQDAAALIVNPMSAAAMVDLVPAGGAFIASGAASQLGKLMAGLAREQNKRMIGLVRRDAPVEALKTLGAAHVLNETNETFLPELGAVLKAEKPTIFLDCVAGSVSARVFDAMGNDSRWIVYGKLTTEPPEILEPGKLIFQRKRIEGFWLVTWMRNTGFLRKLSAIRQVQKRFADGRWSTDISATIKLRNVIDDLAPALNQPDGKVMISTE
jgi:NADPH:quinone reductase-like Zn-dependent oxidoreductase